MPARPTIHDVARHAGVSATTVSHVLNGRGRVNVETAERVHASAQALDYRVNPLARNLRHARFGALGLYLPEHSLSFQFYVDLALAASHTAFGHGCGLMLLPPSADADQLRRLPLDGIIVAEPKPDDPVVADVAASGVDLVLCEAIDRPSGAKVHAIDNQHGPAMAELLDHLVGQGAGQIVVVGADASVAWGRLTRAAVDGWNAGRAREGRSQARWVTVPFACAPDEARGAVDAVLDSGTPDALVVVQQGLAGAALASATAHGLRVPDDLLLACGVDGPDLVAMMPTVTALDLRPREAGEIAAQLLLGERSEPVVELRPNLMARASTARRSPPSRRRS